MTCPRCEREVTLIGGICGHCSSEIAASVKEGFEDIEVHHVTYNDGTYEVTFVL